MKPLPVHGYTDQDDSKVELVNQHKVIEEQLLRRLDGMKDDAQYDQRWLSIARTMLEEGFMALNRAVFKPQRFDIE